MSERKVRMGIDVGGTHTKAVAIDNATHEIIGKSSVKTTHDDKAGVATGVVQAFKNCLKENDIDPKDVIFVAHSTTQATNALIEGDVAQVGVIGIGGKGPGGWIAKAQTNLKDIDLGSGRSIHLHNRYLDDDTLSDASVKAAIQELTGEGAQVIVASEVYGVDDMENETGVCGIAKQMGLEATAASEITKLYGLTRRTRTAAINASILPKMLNTANETEESVRSAGVEVPLMIMRGDGGVMEISEMKKRPVLTMLSGPAASVMGSLMYLRASNGVYFEVGGTTTNIGVIKDGRPAIDYSIVGGHRTYISSLDVRVLGVAGGSMVRADKSGVKDVGPRSAHIAGMDYAVFTPEEEIVDPKVIFFSPKEGDPDDYVAIELASGKRITITNTCAANVLGLISPDNFAYGNANAALPDTNRNRLTNSPPPAPTAATSASPETLHLSASAESLWRRTAPSSTWQNISARKDCPYRKCSSAPKMISIICKKTWATRSYSMPSRKAARPAYSARMRSSYCARPSVCCPPCSLPEPTAWTSPTATRRQSSTAAAFCGT